jgi:PEP-CTERM motif
MLTTFSRARMTFAVISKLFPCHVKGRSARTRFSPRALHGGGLPFMSRSRNPLPSKFLDVALIASWLLAFHAVPLAASIIQRPPAAVASVSASTVVYVAPMTSTMGPGERTSVGIDAADLVNNYAEQFSILFNPKILSAIDILEGILLTSSGPGVFISNFDNAVGDINIAYTSLGPGQGISGRGRLVTVDFYALALGVSNVEIDNAVFLDQHLADQPVNVVGGRVNVVPEPATLFLAGIAFLAMNVLLKRRGRSERATSRSVLRRMLGFSTKPGTRPLGFRNIAIVVLIVCAYTSELSASGAIQSVSFNPSTVIGGSSTTGTVCLIFSQHSQALNVGINNYHPAASAPSYVTIPAGQQCANFSVSTRDVQSTTTGQIGAYWIPDSTQSAYGTLTVTPRMTCVVPGITVQPQDQTVQPGRSATLGVTATGTSPLTYAWRLNGQAAGTNSNVFTTPPLNANATVDVTVSNRCGRPVQSGTANITVKIDCVPPSISSQTASQTIRPGETVYMSVSALGSLIQFQWDENGLPISGATLSSYTTPRQYGGAVYSVALGNTCGSVSSVPIVISIGPSCPGGICTQPVHDVQIISRLGCRELRISETDRRSAWIHCWNRRKKIRLRTS